MARLYDGGKDERRQGIFRLLQRVSIHAPREGSGTHDKHHAAQLLDMLRPQPGDAPIDFDHHGRGRDAAEKESMRKLTYIRRWLAGRQVQMAVCLPAQHA